jgi:hypothetical protein
MQPVLASGRVYGVDYTNYASKSLREILLLHIPPEKLRGVDLAAFGLAA